MISEERLKILLKDNFESDKEFNDFFKKKLKTLYQHGNEENIKEVIKVLKTYNLFRLIESCPGILAIGKSSEITKILNLLSEKNLLNCVKVCPSILATGKSSEIVKIIDLLSEKDLLTSVKVCPSILAKGKSSEIVKIIDLLSEKDLLNCVKVCPTILAHGKSSEIVKIIDLLSEKDLLNSVEECPTILAHGKSSEIVKIIDLLSEKDLLNSVEECPTILAHGKSSEIVKIIDLLSEKDLLNFVKVCPYILAKGKSSEIVKIIDLLSKRDLLNCVKECPTILAKGKSDEIVKIIDLLSKRDLLNCVEKCPSILAHGKSNKVSKILDLLLEKDLLDLVRKCPTILVNVDFKQIERMLNKIETINGNINNVSPSLLLDYDRVCDIVELKKDEISKEEYSKNLKLHLRLINQYNVMCSKEELISLSNKLNMTYEEFLVSLFNLKDDSIEELKEKNYFWIGDNIPVTNEQLNIYQNEIVDISSAVSKSFKSKYPFLTYEEIYDHVLDCIMQKGGAILTNFGDTKLLYPFLFKYLEKRCYFLFENINKDLNYDKSSNLKAISYQEGSYDLENDFIDNYQYLSSTERLVLQNMSIAIESGYDYISFLEEQLLMDQAEILEILSAIKTKIIEHENKNGDNDNFQKAIKLKFIDCKND